MPRGADWLLDDAGKLTRHGQGYLAGIEDVSKLITSPLGILGKLDFSQLTVAQAIALLGKLDFSQLTVAQAISIIGKLDFSQLANLQIEAIATKLVADATALATVQTALTSTIKVWGSFYWNNTSVVINGSFNLASVVRNAAGDYTLSFTNAMVDAKYSLLATSAYSAGSPQILTVAEHTTGVAPAQTATLKSATQLRIVIGLNAALFDPFACDFAIIR
jgi:hypothetical protein